MRAVSLIALIMSLLSASAEAGMPADTASEAKARDEMVDRQIRDRGVVDPRVLEAMRLTLRQHFVPKRLRTSAYSDRPLPIGEGQTISQPYIVALMTESLNLGTPARVLEIGTGSGYQAAVLANVAQDVFTIEIRKKLHDRARQLFEAMKLTNIQSRNGDGYYGWQSAAPFDAIMITAAVDHIPPPLLGQLKEGGRLVLPLGNPFGYQNLVLVTKKGEDYTVRQITGVLFVPMTGQALTKQKAD